MGNLLVECWSTVYEALGLITRTKQSNQNQLHCYPWEYICILHLQRSSLRTLRWLLGNDPTEGLPKWHLRIFRNCLKSTFPPWWILWPFLRAPRSAAPPNLRKPSSRQPVMVKRVLLSQMETWFSRFRLNKGQKVRSQMRPSLTLSLQCPKLPHGDTLQRHRSHIAATWHPQFPWLYYRSCWLHLSKDHQHRSIHCGSLLNDF